MLEVYDKKDPTKIYYESDSFDACELTASTLVEFGVECGIRRKCHDISTGWEEITRVNGKPTAWFNYGD